MLRYSKFVNTKAFRRAGYQENQLQVPSFSKSVLAKIQENELIENKLIHPLVYLEKMQRLEELNNKNEDWQTFFMGMTESANEMCLAEEASGELVSSYAPNESAALTEPLMITAPKPYGSTCLDEIFNDLIGENYHFQSFGG